MEDPADGLTADFRYHSISLLLSFDMTSPLKQQQFAGRGTVGTVYGRALFSEINAIRAVIDRACTDQEFNVHPLSGGGNHMRAEVLEESIRAEIEEQAERFGVNYNDLSTNVQSWLRSLVMQQLYNRDTEPTVSPETGDEE